MTTSIMVRAYVYTKRGKPSDVLELKDDYQVPELQQNEVRIRVHAVGLNPVDWKLMKYMPQFMGKRPAVAASDYSGTIVESNSSRFVPGDEVYGIVHSTVKVARGLGSLAEEIVGPAHSCAKRPESLNAVQAAGLSLVGLTAIALAKEVQGTGDNTAAQPQQQRILVCGGASSVGMALVSTLHHRGHFVATTCSKAKEELVTKRGADVTFDYKQGNLAEQLTAYTKEHGPFDTVLDCADAFDVWQVCGTILKANKSYVNVGADLTQGILPLARRMVSYFLRPAWLGGVPRKYKRPTEIATQENMDLLEELVNKDVIVPLVDSEYSFDQTVEAFEHLMSNRATGKVIVRVREG